jgi:hypothetical protein
VRIPETEAVRASDIALPDPGVDPARWLARWRAEGLKEARAPGQGAPSREELGMRVAELARRLREPLGTEATSRGAAMGILQEIHDRRAAFDDDGASAMASALLRGSVRQFSLILAKSLTVKGDESAAVDLFHELANQFASFLEGVVALAATPDFWALDESRRHLARRIQTPGGGTTGSE